ncbi:MAG: NYN domain-containing protein [Lachnospiraceae bacterium]|nr:NYN domain-containing protein [Lachnospiraceae bacterium]
MTNSKITIGIMAHVDAGKTTLSEQILFHSGALRKAGRVDHGDSFLDMDAMERSRGITIFSKEAQFQMNDISFVLLDTPGHGDFSAETERVLCVLDYAVLLISAADGVTGYTEVLWQLLKNRGIPTFIFVNKMDQFEGPDRETRKEEILRALEEKLSEDILDFSLPKESRDEDFWERVAMTDEGLLDLFLKRQAGGADAAISRDELAEAVLRRNVMPCFFGSALKQTGIEEFLEELCSLVKEKTWPQEMGGRIFKVSRDPQGQRLLHVRMTGGSLSVRDEITLQKKDEKTEETAFVTEKITQIRVYSGGKFETVQSAVAGDVAVLCGLTGGYASEGFGFEADLRATGPVPVLSYQVSGPGDVPIPALFEKLRLLDEENPEISLRFEQETGKIYLLVMGQVQSQILAAQMEERFGMPITFGQEDVVYHETIENTVEGVGHFEPLRHYAEVHLILEPAERGSGLTFASKISTDRLSLNWQRLILQHLGEKKHRGVLTGAPITDMKITLCDGKAHLKHTEGGDFRQATYRAVRQGLMQARSILLEPYYKCRITVPSANIGRVLTDLEQRSGSGTLEIMGEEISVISGRAPVATIRDYAESLMAFSGGRGRIEFRYDGYDICHNTEEVLEQKHYDPLTDVRNRSDSVFCVHGSGQSVPWDEVFDHMHLPSVLAEKKKEDMLLAPPPRLRQEKSAGNDELREIFEKTYKTSFDGKRPDPSAEKRRITPKNETAGESVSSYKKKQDTVREKVLLVDGYNLMHADPQLKELSRQNLDSARDALLDMLSDYHGMQEGRLIAVFDAYKVPGRAAVSGAYHNIEVVFTKQDQTADMYIEKTVHELHKKSDVTVVTSDGIEQVVSSGQGAMIRSSREFLGDMQRQREMLRKDHNVSE